MDYRIKDGNEKWTISTPNVSNEGMIRLYESWNRKDKNTFNTNIHSCVYVIDEHWKSHPSLGSESIRDNDDLQYSHQFICERDTCYTSDPEVDSSDHIWHDLPISTWYERIKDIRDETERERQMVLWKESYSHFWYTMKNCLRETLNSELLFLLFPYMRTRVQ